MRDLCTTAALAILASLLLVTPLMAATIPSPIAPVLGEPDSSKTYDDESFQEQAAFAIYNLTSPLPTENRLMELKSLYYEVVRKNISPEYYNQAYDTAKYLFYVLKTAEQMQDLNTHVSTGGNSVLFYDDIREQANLDLVAAKDVWQNISALYPNATIVSIS